MTESLRKHTRGLATVALALLMLTLAPVVSSSFPRTARQGGDSVIYKNGPTPVWMARAFGRTNESVWS
jgi:hypothetical protein